LALNVPDEVYARNAVLSINQKMALKTQKIKIIKSVIELFVTTTSTWDPYHN
jgi:hypothetical protein